jgi:hypothetical protein
MAVPNGGLDAALMGFGLVPREGRGVLIVGGDERIDVFLS